MLQIVRAILQQIIEDIDSGNCNASEDELQQLYEKALHYKKSTQYLTKEEAAHYIGISRATFDRKVADGIIPPGVKRSGLKCVLWSQATLDPFRK